MREEIFNWWKQAEKDLKASENSLNSGDYEWACFQAHQSVEKALKALYLKQKKELNPSHNLVILGKALKLPLDLIEYLKELTPEYTLSRYPDVANASPFEVYTEKKAKEKINQAGIVVKWIEKQLHQ